MVAVLLVCSLILSEPTTSWPRFRGPNGTGVGAGFAWPKTWDASALRWKVSLPGQGHGSPVIHAGRIYLQAATPDRRLVLALNAQDGKTLWQRDIAGHASRMHKKNTLASGSAATDGERVVFCHWDGRNVTLAAYRCTDGTPLWSIPLGPHESQHGAAYSPILHQGKVLVIYDTDTVSEVVCCDVKSGKKVWAQSRKVYRASYSSPVIRTGRGGEEVVVANTAGITGYDFATGEVKWDWSWPFQNAPLRTVSSPLLCPNEMLLAGGGDGGGDRDTVAVSLPSADTSDGSGVRLRWQLHRDVPYVPCLLQHGESVFFVADKGVAGCLDLATGKERWLQRLGGNFTASPLLIDNRVVACNEEGDLFVFAANGTRYEPLGKLRLGQQIYATPALADGKLYIRTLTHLVCLGAAP
jgi:outer membrane protein assembly factor BamB